MLKEKQREGDKLQEISELLELCELANR